MSLLTSVLLPATVSKH
ncbi:UNVERIFIED_CONTAM: hypothetical protein GTU68_009450 [Idotea baltica]|nr:hypothetical protein [Idotea baltica]